MPDVQVPTMPKDAALRLAAGDASARIALWGAEPTDWRIGERDLLWDANPAFWSRHAPILFPVVGASANGTVRIAGATYPMPQHGFARDALFTVLDQDADAAHLRLTESDETRSHFPFPFALDVTVRLGPQELALAFTVTNTGTEEMPYALGFHPAFRWPFDATSRDGHRVEFERAENPQVPVITATGLFANTRRPVPLAGRTLPLDPSLFTEALPFLDARSRSLRFVSPTGAAIAMTVDDFPHLALWTKPAAPFLSMEAWTGHADPEGFAGDLFARPSMRRLAPGERAQHALTLRWQPT